MIKNLKHGKKNGKIRICNNNLKKNKISIIKKNLLKNKKNCQIEKG